MAKGRVISVRKLTEKDKIILEYCEQISKIIMSDLLEVHQNDFWKNYGKVNFTRDAGSGRAGGKLQRDALCTPGMGGKDPLSNRNLRWHPLVVADTIPEGFNECNLRIDNEEKTIYIDNGEEEWLPEDVYKLSEPYCLTPQEWRPFDGILKEWDMKDWDQNNMIILAAVYSPWYDALETFALLGIIIGSSFYNGNLEHLYEIVTKFLSSIKIDDINLPSDKFPLCDDKLLMCPVCLAPINGSVASLPRIPKENSWIAPWKTKKKAINDSDLWTFHMDPMIESEIKHNAKNVRFGHRWCAISKSDHSITEHLDYMRKILENHRNL
ncbi:hypothetical protein LCGC14_1291900 [marine sediment metagenome]|uniref:Uncharacterized protein n=1 Tax=marine sediment metagenome TaxID=412755 RepID=A0A0F9KSB0_9ZZZZ